VKVPTLFVRSKTAVAVRSIVAITIATALMIGGSAAPAFAVSDVPAASAATTPTAGLSTPGVSATASVSATAAVPAAKPKAKPKKAKKVTTKQRITKVAKAKKLNTKEVAALLWICKHESGFNVAEVSSAGCYGLFQLSRGMVHGHPWKQPEWNTARAIKYMKGRYGGVLQAKRFWLAHHWY
jgi:colicin import membrane protein